MFRITLCILYINKTFIVSYAIIIFAVNFIKHAVLSTSGYNLYFFKCYFIIQNIFIIGFT